MIPQIPTSSELPLYTQRTTLDGVDYILRFDWNARSETWFLQLFDSDEVQLTGMIRIVLGLPLLRLHHATPGVPPGDIIAIDPAVQIGEGQVRPAFAELGSRVRLLYVEASELEE